MDQLIQLAASLAAIAISLPKKQRLCRAHMVDQRI
jgi:hypothetical protein